MFQAIVWRRVPFEKSNVVVLSAISETRRYRKTTGRVKERELSRMAEEAARKKKEEYFMRTTSAAVGKPEEGQRGFLGIGRVGRSQPLNPQLVMNKVDDPSSTKLLAAMKLMKRDKDTSVHISDEMQEHIADAYARTRWYAPLWRTLQKISPAQAKRWRRISQAVIFVVLIANSCILLLLYYQELRTVYSLSDDVRDAYIKIVLGMRYSEVFAFINNFRENSDPKGVLPPETLVELATREMMKLGWHTVDWKLEQRTRYKKSAWEDYDIAHLFYWLVMGFGSTISGSSDYFSDPFIYGGILSGVAEERRNRTMSAAMDSSEQHGPLQRPPVVENPAG